MTDLEKAARQALEALEKERERSWKPTHEGAVAIQALRRALEQPAQQKPVAWVVEDQYGERLEWAGDADVGWGLKTFALYTRPQTREWVGLTDEEIGKAFDDYMEGRFSTGFNGSVRAIEAKLKEKNGF